MRPRHLVSHNISKLVCQLVAMALCIFSANAFATTPMDASIAPMLKNVLPAIVNIKAQIKVTDFNTLRELQKQRSNVPNADTLPVPNTYVSVGSGVIVDAKNGYILTNAHVVSDAQNVSITLSDGHHYTAKIIGIDKPSDIAIIQIRAKNITAVTLGDSNTVKVGDFVAAIGNPFGLGQSVSSGIVSALGRTTLGIENYENFIQTDAPINRGNSGGALVDMQGRVIGINTAILATDSGNIGIGFAIPSNMAKLVMEQLLHYGNVKRGILGISAQDLTPELAQAFNVQDAHGAAVPHVLPFSPAELGGIKVGDIITSVNGNPIKSSSDVINTIGFLRVDSKVKITVLRNTKPLTLTVTLSDPKIRKMLATKNDPFLFGVALKDFSLESPSHGGIKGVLVVNVEQDSMAWHSDLRPGDVITSANQQAVTSLEKLHEVAKKANQDLLLNVVRGGGAIFVVINKEDI